MHEKCFNARPEGKLRLFWSARAGARVANRRSASVLLLAFSLPGPPTCAPYISSFAGVLQKFSQNLFFDLIKATGIYIFWGSAKNRTICERHGDSDTWVISDNGGRVPRAALREIVMTKATPARIGSVNVSGL